MYVCPKGVLSKKLEFQKSNTYAMKIMYDR
jgi:hypothetical protein